MNTRITVAYGDGIGPEIMEATINILKASGAKLEFDRIEIGEKVYLKGIKNGIEDSSWDTLRQNGILLKAPITTPQGGGYNSLNVTMRKRLGLFANVRPVKAYSPFIKTHFPNMDLVIVRENEEDLYAGIEYQQTAEVVQCLKLVSKTGCERIVRYAFEYAKTYNRKRVTCMTKDNIMKLTDGLFHQTFNQIAKEYPDIAADHFIIDIGSAFLADRPEGFEVIVTMNLYGDIISDIAAEVAGSVGLGGSANIGQNFAMFEAIHGSAPDIAGKDMANPSGLLNGAIMMLVHLGQSVVAEKIANALLKTIEDGLHTGDIYQEKISQKKVGTKEFSEAIIERLGQKPLNFKPTIFNPDIKPIKIITKPHHYTTKILVGVDVFLDWNGTQNRNPNELGEQIKNLHSGNLAFKMITNRGVKVYPDGIEETFCTDHWRCRFAGYKEGENPEATPATHQQIIDILTQMEAMGLHTIKTENKYYIDGKREYSLAQGE